MTTQGSLLELNRAGKDLPLGGSILLIQLGEAHIGILQEALRLDERLGFYYFATLFEQSYNKWVNESTVHVHITKITIGAEAQEGIDGDGGTHQVWAVRADLKISQSQYHKLRLPFREHMHTYPNYKLLE